MTARSTAEARRIEPTGITTFRQADIGEYLREVMGAGSATSDRIADGVLGGHAFHDLSRKQFLASKGVLGKSYGI